MTCSAAWSYTLVRTELLVLLTSAAQDSSQNLDPLHASHCNDKIMFFYFTSYHTVSRRHEVTGQGCKL